MTIEVSKLGLTKGESKVYNSLISEGSLKASEVAKISKVSYSKVYEVLDRLIEKGLVSFIFKNKIKYFNVVEPHKLVEFINKKEEELKEQKEVIQDLILNIQLKNKEKSQNNAEVFLGINGLRTAYKTILNSSNENDKFRYFFPLREYDKNVCDFYEKIHAFQKSKQLDERGIAHRDFEKTKYYQNIKEHLKFKFVDFPIPSTIEILNEYVLIVSWESQTGFLITSKDIAKQFNEYFDEIWINIK